MNFSSSEVCKFSDSDSQMIDLQDDNSFVLYVNSHIFCRLSNIWNILEVKSVNEMETIISVPEGMVQL